MENEFSELRACCVALNFRTLCLPYSMLFYHVLFLIHQINLFYDITKTYFIRLPLIYSLVSRNNINQMFWYFHFENMATNIYYSSMPYNTHICLDVTDGFQLYRLFLVVVIKASRWQSLFILTTVNSFIITLWNALMFI